MAELDELSAAADQANAQQQREAVAAARKASGESVITIGDTVVHNGRPVASADELIEWYGFHAGQIVHNAKGTDHYSVHDVVRDVWFQAMWRARAMSETELDRWLAEGSEQDQEIHRG